MRIGLGVAYRNLERLEDAIGVGRKASTKPAKSTDTGRKPFSN